MSIVETEWLSGAKLAAMLGVTSMTIWRWQQNVKLAFPPPTVIHGRKYWHRDAVNSWMRSKAVAKADGPTRAVSTSNTSLTDQKTD